MPDVYGCCGSYHILEVFERNVFYSSYYTSKVLDIVWTITDVQRKPSLEKEAAVGAQKRVAVLEQHSPLTIHPLPEVSCSREGQGSFTHGYLEGEDDGDGDHLPPTATLIAQSHNDTFSTWVSLPLKSLSWVSRPGLDLPPVGLSEHFPLCV